MAVEASCRLEGTSAPFCPRGSWPCFEAEKELDLLKDKISDEQQKSTKELISNIRKDIETENFESLNSVLEELKLAMKNMADANHP